MDGDIELVPTGPPRALRATFWATVVWSAISLLAVLELFAEKPYLRKTLIDSNRKAKKPIANYTGHVVDDAVQRSLIIGVVVTLLVVVILLLLAQLAWRGRPWARWALIGMATVPGVFFGVGVIGQLAFGTLQSSPGGHKLPTVLAGIASLVVIVLLVDKDTRTYFAAVRDTKRGALPPVSPGDLPARGDRGRRARPPAAASPAANAGWTPRAGGVGALFRKAMAPTPTPRTADDDAAPAGGAPLTRPPAAPPLTSPPVTKPGRRQRCSARWSAGSSSLGDPPRQCQGQGQRHPPGPFQVASAVGAPCPTSTNCAPSSSTSPWCTAGSRCRPGREADYYIDLRRITLHRTAAPLVGRVLRDLTADWDYAAVGGLTLGADPVATAVMHAARRRGRRVRRPQGREEARHAAAGRRARRRRPAGARRRGRVDHRRQSADRGRGAARRRGRTWSASPSIVDRGARRGDRGGRLPVPRGVHARRPRPGLSRA